MGIFIRSAIRIGSPKASAMAARTAPRATPRMTLLSLDQLRWFDDAKVTMRPSTSTAGTWTIVITSTMGTAVLTACSAYGRTHRAIQTSLARTMQLVAVHPNQSRSLLGAIAALLTTSKIAEGTAETACTRGRPTRRRI